MCSVWHHRNVTRWRWEGGKTCRCWSFTLGLEFQSGVALLNLAGKPRADIKQVQALHSQRMCFAAKEWGMQAVKFGLVWSAQPDLDQGRFRNGAVTIEHFTSYGTRKSPGTHLARGDQFAMDSVPARPEGKKERDAPRAQPRGMDQ